MNERADEAEARRFRDALARLGWNKSMCARRWDTAQRTVDRWAAGSTEVPGSVWHLLSLEEKRLVDPPAKTPDIGAALAPHLSRLVKEAGRAGWDERGFCQGSRQPR